MLRVLHTADLHLGARHLELGSAAATQRERQFEALTRTIDLAVAERVDLFLVAGDLFDSNVQPRRLVERVATELGRLTSARIRTVIVPGLNDLADSASIYAAHDLRRFLKLAPSSDLLTILGPERPTIAYASLDLAVHTQVFTTKRAPSSPLAAMRVIPGGRPTWNIGVLHGSLLVPGRVEDDDVIFSREEIAESGLDYLALGHWHSAYIGDAGATRYAYSGSPEAVSVDEDEAGSIFIVSFEKRDGHRSVDVQTREIGRTRFEKVDVDAESIPNQKALVAELARRGDRDLVLDCRIVGDRPDGLELDETAIEAELAKRFLKIRVRDRSIAAVSSGPIPTADTIVGAFIRDVEARVADAEGGGRADEAAELREALRLGRRLLEGGELAS